MKRKALIEKRQVKAQELKALSEVETREEGHKEKFDALVAEIESIDTEIREIDKVNELLSGTPQQIIDGGEKIEMNKELREFLLSEDNKEVELRELVKGVPATGNDVSIGTGANRQQIIGNNSPGVVGVDFIGGIIARAEEISPLFSRASKITTSGTTVITFQGRKLGKFVYMNELDTYAKKTMTLEQKVLNAYKFGSFVVLSEELIKDSMFNLEQEIARQMGEGLGMTMNELMLKGHAAGGSGSTKNIFGLLDANHNTGQADTTAARVQFPTGAQRGVLTSDIFVKMFYSMKSSDRNGSVWIMNNKTAMAASLLKDANGMPLMYQSFNETPSYKILGLDVIIDDNMPDLSTTAEGTEANRVKPLLLVNLDKAVKVGLRSNMTLKRSDEYGFANDSIAFKGNVRLDITSMDERAIVYAINAD